MARVGGRRKQEVGCANLQEQFLQPFSNRLKRPKYKTYYTRFWFRIVSNASQDWWQQTPLSVTSDPVTATNGLFDLVPRALRARNIRVLNRLLNRQCVQHGLTSLSPSLSLLYLFIPCSKFLSPYQPQEQRHPFNGVAASIWDF